MIRQGETRKGDLSSASVKGQRLLQTHLHLPVEQKDPWQTGRVLQKQSYLARTQILEQTIALCIAKTHQMADVVRIQV